MVGRIIGSAVFLCAASVATGASHGNVKRALLADYGDPSVRPSAAPSSPGSCPPEEAPVDVVEAQIHIDRYHAINHIKQTFGVDGCMRAWWRDPPEASRAGSCRRARPRLGRDAVGQEEGGLLPGSEV